MSGISLRVVVLELDPVEEAKTYVNPQVIWASPEMILHREGSVSMPGVHDEIERHARVWISYHDLDGEAQTEEASGLRAVCHQHEIDQLDGLFWIQRLSPAEARAVGQAVREAVARVRRGRSERACSQRRAIQPRFGWVPHPVTLHHKMEIAACTSQKRDRQFSDRMCVSADQLMGDFRDVRSFIESSWRGAIAVSGSVSSF